MKDKDTTEDRMLQLSVCIIMQFKECKTATGDNYFKALFELKAKAKELAEIVIRSRGVYPSLLEE